MRTYTEQFIDSVVELDNFLYYLEEGFNPELLEREEAKAIWQYIKEYYERSQRKSIPSVEILEEEFVNWRFVEPQAEPHWILDKLKERWQFREAQDLVIAVSKMKPDEIFPHVKEKIWEASQVLDTERNVIGIEDFDKMMDLYWSKWETGDHYGLTTGFKAIDAEMGGIRRGQLAILAGRLKTGKTWFGLKAFIEQRRQMVNPIFFTLEMSTEEIWVRYLALISGISYDALDKGYISPSDWHERIGPALEEERQYGDFWVVQPPQGQRKVSDFITLADKYKCGSMIIDQLSWIEARMSGRDYFRDDLRVTDIAQELKLAAQRPGREMPVYVMHQFNRQQKADEELDDVNFADADGILRTADHGFGIAQTKELRDQNQIRFEIVRSRHSRQGGTFTCDFEFYDKTNMEAAVKGETIGEMTVDEAAMLLGSGSTET